MQQKILGLHDIEDLSYLAEEVLQEIRFNGYRYDDEGNTIFSSMSEEEITSKCVEFLEDSKNNYLEFRDNEVLKKISFSEAFEMELSEIKDKYLKNILKKARGIMRKASLPISMLFLDEIDDEYLDNLLAIRWRENLKLWIIHWSFEENLAAKFLVENKNEEHTKSQKVRELILSDESLSNSPIPTRFGESDTWVVKTKSQIEIGNLDYIASEFVEGGIIYRFHNYNKSGKEGHHNHGHSITAVLDAIIYNPKGFSIEGFENDYSQQERDFLNAFRNKLLIK